MKKHILITGLPGVGKTTLIKQVVVKLREMNVPVNGFYTEEVREGNSRIGFDIVTLDNDRGILARKGGASSFKVGSYSVFPENLERLVVPILENPLKVLIIDEIGKMELFSKQFQHSVRKVLGNKELVAVATVPSKAGGFVNELKKSPGCHLITVTPSNRNELLGQIMSLIKE